MRLQSALFPMFLLAAALQGEDLTVRLAAGSVQIQTPSGLVKAKVGDKVRVGDQLVTGESSFAALKSDDGSVFKIAAGTTFDVARLQSSPTSRAQTFKINKGKVLANISKLNKESDISFETPSAVAGVRGTVLILDVRPEGTVIYVQRGLVEVRKPSPAKAAKEGGGKAADVAAKGGKEEAGKGGDEGKGGKEDGKGGKEDKGGGDGEKAMVGAGEKTSVQTGDKGGGAPKVEKMTESDKKESGKGIPVKITIQLNDSPAETKNAVAAEVKADLRAASSEQQGQLQQSKQNQQAAAQWDVDNGRLVLMGKNTYQVSQRFKKVDANTVHTLVVVNNQTESRLSTMDATVRWKNGIPDIGKLLASDPSSSPGASANPQNANFIVAGQEKGKSADLIQYAITYAPDGSRSESYTINLKDTYSGNRIQATAKTSGNGPLDTTVVNLLNANGSVDYSFVRSAKTFVGDTGADTSLAGTSIQPSQLLTFLQGLGSTSVYVQYADNGSTAGATKSFNGSKMEIITTSEYASRVLVSLLSGL